MVVEKKVIRHAGSHTNWLIFIGTTLLAITIDLWSKSTVFSWVFQSPDLRISIVPGRLEFLARYNDAGIWSLGNGTPYSNSILALLGVGIVSMMFCWSWYMLASCSRTMAFLLGLILGGALGNLYDRFAFAGVRDFIQVYLWGGYAYPTFNLADSFMVVSVIIIATMLFRLEPASPPDPLPQKV